MEGTGGKLTQIWDLESIGITSDDHFQCMLDLRETFPSAMSNMKWHYH